MAKIFEAIECYQVYQAHNTEADYLANLDAGLGEGYINVKGGAPRFMPLPWQFSALSS